MLAREHAADPKWLQAHIERCTGNQTTTAYRALANRWMADIRNIGWGDSLVDILRLSA